MGCLLLVAFLVVPVAELWVVLRVADVIGGWETIGLLIVMSFVGSWLVKREGARAWGAFQTAMKEGRVPAKETADGALVILGGALLLTPGFLTDVLGVLCLLPPTRVVVRRTLLRFALRHNPVYETYDTARTVAGAAQRVQRVRSRRMPDRRAANEPPREPPPEDA